MGFFARLLGKSRTATDMRALWHQVVALAREPQWYARLGIADTVAGRFDAVTMVLALVLLRMETEPALRAATARLTELFVSDMDGQLRQEGVGDLVVGKRMGKLVSALGGRIEAYRNGFAAGDALVLAQAVERNVTLVEGANSAELADAMRALAARLGATGSADLLAGRIAP